MFGVGASIWQPWWRIGLGGGGGEPGTKLLAGTVGPLVGLTGDLTEISTPALAGTIGPLAGLAGDLTADTEVNMSGTVGPLVGLSGDLDIAVGLDPQAAAIIAAMTGTPDSTRQSVINDTILALDAAGLLDKLDALYFLAAHDAQAATINWINPAAFQLIAISSLTFTADLGAKSNGTTSYYRSQYTPSANAIHYAANSACLFARATESEAGVNVGHAAAGSAGASSAGRSQIVPPRVAGNASGNITANNSLAFTVTEPRQLLLINRTASNAKQLYLAGVSVATEADADTTALSTAEFHVLGYNANGSASHFFNEFVGVVGWGSALTAQNNTDLNTIIEAYLTAVL